MSLHDMQLADDEDKQDTKQDSSERSQDSEGEDEEEGEEGDQGSKDAGYEFSHTETTILEVVMDSMRTCGLAYALQALSTLLLGERWISHA